MQSEREKLANELMLLSDGGATGISFDLYDLADYILQREQEAFKRGRIAEAKTCEEAKRHQPALTPKAEAIAHVPVPKSTEPSLPKNASVTPQDSTANPDQANQGSDHARFHQQ